MLAFCVDKAFRNTTILAERLALPLYRQDVAAARKGFNDLSRIERPLEDDYSCPALDGARRLFDSLATMTEGRALTGHRRPRRPKEEGRGGSVTSASRAAKQDWRPYLWDTAAVAAEEAAVRKALAQGTSRWHRGPTARSRFERRARALWSSDSATTVGRVGVWDTEGLAHWMRGSNRARAAGFSLAIRGHSVGDACGRRRSGGRARARALGGARHPPPGQAPSPCPEADVAKDRFESESLVRAKVDAILAGDTDTLTAPGMIARATWADAWRSAGHRETAPWHFVDQELGHPDLSSGCFGRPALSGAVASAGPAQDCVVDKIDEFTAELASPSTTPAERLLALK